MQLSRIPAPTKFAPGPLVLEMTASVRVTLKEKVDGAWVASDQGIVTAFLKKRAGMDGSVTCTISFDRARPAIQGLELNLVQASFFVLKLACDDEIELKHSFKAENLGTEFALFASADDLKPLAYQVMAELKGQASF